MELDGTVLEEPLLVFGHGGKHVDPKAGLALFGPAGHSKGGRAPASIVLGFVGASESVETARQWCLELNSPSDNDKENTRLFPPFPGMGPAFNCLVMAPENLAYEIPPRELATTLEIKSHKKRVISCSNLFKEGLEVLKQKAGPPNIVIFPWSEEIIDKCAGTISTLALPSTLRTFRDMLMDQEDMGQQRLFPLAPEAQDLLLTGRSNWNLHSQMKLDAMGTSGIRIPVQVLEPQTYRGESQLKDPTTLWNLATGLYYKAGGIPWRPADTDLQTCYVGIEFYRDKTLKNEGMRTCIAQIFIDFGQGLVLRGSSIKFATEREHTPKMDRDTAEKLITQALALYKRHNRVPPARVVVHKTSHFTSAERDGFSVGLRDVEAYDLLTIIKRPTNQFVRRGTNPPIRGTMVELSPTKTILYTAGYVPYFSAYPGLRIPHPILIVNHKGSSGPRRIANEILKLTKLNWNTSRYSSSLPSTLMYADFVKEVLSQAPEEQEISEDYSSYM